MEAMFEGAEKFNRNISDWYVHTVVTCATCSRYGLPRDLTGWEMGNVEDATDMLTGTAMHSRYTAEQRLGAGHAIVDRGL